MFGRVRAPVVALLLLGLQAPPPAEDPPALIYSFGVVPGEAAALSVELRIAESQAGPIRLRLPSEWAGQSGLERVVTGLRAVTPGDRLIDTDTAWVKVLDHVGGALAVVRYELRQDWTGPIQSPAYYRALVQRDWALLVGENALVLPEERADEPRSVALDFTYLPSEWNVGTSYGAGRGRQEVLASADALRNIEIVLGLWRSRDVRVGGKPIHVFQHGSQGFSDAAFDSVLGSIVGIERTFWHARAPDDYLVSLMPTRGGEHGGTRLTGAFMVAIDSTAPLDQLTVKVLAHELFHEWNGGLLRAAPGTHDHLKWFSEGVTDFYAWELAHRSKAISDSVYAAGVNDLLRERGTSAWRDSSADALERNYWLKDEAKLEFYHRGNVFSLRADRALRDATRGRKSMDHVMRRLAADSSHAALTDSVIAAAFRTEGLPDAPRWMAEMLTGRPIPLGPESLGKCFVGDWYSTPRFDLGFDLAASQAAKSLRGVDSRSAGYAAGLRDSLPLAGLSIYHGDASKNATITVIGPDGTRTRITYRPATADSVTILRFFPRPGC
jgi:predicted metalloprotease with PDZ domain